YGPEPPTGPASAPPGPASAPGSMPAPHGLGAPPVSPAGQPAYQGSGLTAADLQFSTEPKPSGGGVWKIIGAVVGVLALLAAAGAGGYFLRGQGGPDKPPPKNTATVATAAEIQKKLESTGFECGQAYAKPVGVDLCFREDADFVETVGFQLLDPQRTSWLKLRVEATHPSKKPVKPRALELFGQVLSSALPKADAEIASQWLSGNLPEDYEKNEYLTHEAGGARLQLLPRTKKSALLWVRLTGGSYQSVGEPALPAESSDTLEKHYKAEGFTCRASEGGSSCEKKADAGTTVVTYRVTDKKVAAVRLTVTPTGKLNEVTDTAKQEAVTLLGLMLHGKPLNEATAWLEGGFDGKVHHAVVSGLEVRVAPVESPSEGSSRYEVDVRPASW
ncbi:MAG: hypothetical protein ACRDT4_12765, partial [Micromonosporaceae bacterium]